jgi:hypothetical protein
MQFFDQLIRFLRDGIAAIFRFVELIWTWSIEQIQRIPWSNLGEISILKQIFLFIVAAGVIYLLYKAARELFAAGQNALAAFATLLSAIVKTLAPILFAGLAAAGGAWVVNNLNF